ncbi:hypothetical protein ACFV6B_38020 [Streptomyces microflavus]|uniref:hypothetical protein n=1 Tax=Streptomyces microflavus TaxID=1919 RepID=UPI00364F24B2
MRNFITTAAGTDMSGGFGDFFDTIGLTGNGLITKAIAAILVVVAGTMMLKLNSDPKGALRKGGLAVGTLFVAVILAMYGDALFSTVNPPAPKG